MQTRGALFMKIRLEGFSRQGMDSLPYAYKFTNVSLQTVRQASRQTDKQTGK